MSSNSDKIKVVGYAQKVYYNNGIEYLNFSDDLVGNQLVPNENGGSSVLTFGNFITTIKYDSQPKNSYVGGKFSDFETLESLGVDILKDNNIIDNGLTVTLNIDNTKITNHSYFGSATEFLRVSLENIISNWPASLYITPNTIDSNGNSIPKDTFEDYYYDSITDISYFKISNDVINNKFSINYKINASLSFDVDDIRDLVVNYENYVVYLNGFEYPIVGFTGLSDNDNYIYLSVKGSPFNSFQLPSGLSGNKPEYHIKPNDIFKERFFNLLSPFESYLLNRFSKPLYTSVFNVKRIDGNGNLVSYEKTLTWPVSDGYNIDYDTSTYISYVNDLIEVFNAKDEIETDLIHRFLVPRSLVSVNDLFNFETIDQDITYKMSNLLRIYGREYDEIKKYIDGISFSRVVSYDKKNNIPDELVKLLAKTLGWDVVSNIVNVDFETTYFKPTTPSYGGYSRGLTNYEVDIEFWRRIILNSAFIWKSKGSRKAIEFLLKAFGVPDGVIDFKEYVYVVDKPIDVDLFKKVLEHYNLPTDLSNYYVDENGLPKIPTNTSDVYFQMNGGWYRETAGSGTTTHILNGNNPHIGPYDDGSSYIKLFDNVIPNFKPFVLTSTTVTNIETELFTNYNKGIVNDYNGDIYIEPKDVDNNDLGDLVVLDKYKQNDNCPTNEKTDCGCDTLTNDEMIVIDIDKNTLTNNNTCDTNIISTYSYDSNRKFYIWDLNLYKDGSVWGTQTSPFISPECCSSLTSDSPFYYKLYFYEDPYKNKGYRENFVYNNFSSAMTMDIPMFLYDCGYLCCKSRGMLQDVGVNGCGCVLSCEWELVSPRLTDMYYYNNRYYLKFITPDGEYRIVNEADSGFCPVNTGYVNVDNTIIDPYTGKPGYACMLNNDGINMFNTYQTKEDNRLYVLFKLRKWGIEDCCGSDVTMGYFKDSKR